MAAPIVAGRTRRTRQIRATVTLLLALAFLGGAFYTAYSYIQNDARSPQAKASDCATGTVDKPIAKPSTVTVNVYNATSTAGLAAEVARKLKQRGYQIGEIDNDPLKKKVTGSAEIRYGDSGRAQARSARLAIKDAKLVNDKRTDETIDLVIGAKYQDLSAPPTCKSN